jgi:hypothetical protein
LRAPCGIAKFFFANARRILAAPALNLSESHYNQTLAIDSVMK